MTQKELLNPPTVVTLHCILLMDPGKEHMGSKGACNLPCRFKKKTSLVAHYCVYYKGII